MKVIVNRSELINKMAIVGMVVPNNSPSEVFLKSEISFDLDQQIMFISACDGTLSAKVSIPITVEQTLGIEPEYESSNGVYTVTYRAFAAIVSSFKGDSINIETGHSRLSGDIIKLSCGRKKGSVGYIPSEIMKMPINDEKSKFKVGSSSFLSAVKAISSCQHHDETRYYLCGIHLNMEERSIEATNGHVLGVADIEMSDISGYAMGSYIIPSRAISTLIKMKDVSGELDLSVNDNQLTISTNGIEIKTSLIDGQYPDIRRILNAPHDRSCITVSKSELKDCVNSVSLIAVQGSQQKLNQVEINFSNEGYFVVKSNNRGDFAEAEAECEYNINHGEEHLEESYLFNIKYLESILSVAQSESIDWYLGGKIAPTKMNIDDYTFLVMGQKG